MTESLVSENVPKRTNILTNARLYFKMLSFTTDRGTTTIGLCNRAKHMQRKVVTGLGVFNKTFESRSD